MSFQYLQGRLNYSAKPETMKKTPTTKVLAAGRAELILAMAGQDALQLSGDSGA